MNGLRLRSNPAASLAYRNLSKTQLNLQNNIQRLSSGLRINSAADDSAGLAISTRMSNQIRGMKQANRNAQDTHNLLATAESGLSDISDILSKMRELSVQASTDTLNNTDRASLDLEYQSLLDEISRTAKSTNYNDLKILDAESVKYDNFFTVISSEAEKSGVEGTKLNRAEAGVYRFESKTPGELTLIHTLSGEEQTVAVPTNVGQGTSINFSELGVQVEFNNQYDGSVVIGQETIAQAQDILSQAYTSLANREADIIVAQEVFDAAAVALDDTQDDYNTAQGDYDVAQGTLDQAQDTLSQTNTNLANREADIIVAQEVFDAAQSTLTDTQGILTDTQATLAVYQDDYDNASATFNTAQGDYDDAQGTLAVAQDDYDNASATFNTAQDALIDALKELDTSNIDNYDNALAAFNTAQDAANIAFSTRNDAQGTLAVAQDDYDNASATFNTAQDDYDDAVVARNDAEVALNGGEVENYTGGALGARNDAEVALNTAQGTLAEAQVTLAGRETHLSNQQAALNLASNAVTNAETDLNNARDARDNAQVNVGNAETTLSEAIGARRYTSLNGDTFTVNDPDSSSKTFQIGADNDINSQISFSMVNATAAGLSIDGTHLLDIDSARNSITSLDFSIDLTNSERSRLGSLQNRLQFTVSNLNNQTQNIEASRSNIEDVDFAAEAMELTKNQILTQSATAMLAQASALPQNILSLIVA